MKCFYDYIIAPKREFRSVTPADWSEGLKRIGGVCIVVGQPMRVRVRATPQAIAEVRSMLGNMYNIEQSISHYPSAGTLASEN